MIRVNLSKGDDPFNQIEESLRVISEIDSCFDKREEINLDLSGIKWALPCSVILISGKLTEVVNKGAVVSYTPPEDPKVKDWLSSIGFPIGNKPDGDTFVSLKHFRNNPDNKNQVNFESNSLMDSMEDKIPNTFGSSVKYILGELADNMDEHSKFTFASIMAQYYPRKEHLDIAVLDNGITIPFNFENNKIDFDKDSSAIKGALEGEISTKIGEKMRGYGLRSCRDISLKEIKGELHIVSRRGVAMLKEDEKPEFYDFEDVSLDGTFLYFRLPTPKNKADIYPYLEG